jgi:hypothetical protein
MNKKILNILIIISLLLSIIVPFIDYKPAYASSTFTCNVTAQGSDTVDGACAVGTKAYCGGTTDFNNMKSDDGNTSYLQYTVGSSGGWKKVCWDISNFTEAYSSIDSVTIYYKERVQDWVQSSADEAYIKIGGNYYYGTQQYRDTTFTLRSYTWNTNPSTGSAWTAADINSAEFGYAGYWVLCTYFYVVVTYTPQTVPIVTTQAVSNIIYSGGSHYALLNGNLVSWSGNTTDAYRGFVYGTTSITSNPGNVGPYGSGYSTVSANTTGTGTGAYSTNITGMAAGTTYYVRAYAHNSIGYAYGNQYSFTTLANPTVSLLAATNVASSTARINSQVTFDGNSTCNITFGYALASHAADFSAYTSFVNVSGTFNTGGFPYYNLVSLNASATYYYNVRIQNTFGTAYGTELSFTTTSGVNEPTGLLAIPGSNLISVKWVKNSASSTMVRYSTGTYPATTAQGTQAYFGTSSSCLITGLDEGTTYYISAWGYTGGLFSTNYTYTLATTTAFATATTAALPTSPNPSGWLQEPDSSGFITLPFAPLMQNISDAYDFPIDSLWYVAWLIAATVIGLVIYNKGNNNLTMAVIGSVFTMAVGIIGGILGFEMVAIIVGIIIVIIVIAGRY